MDIGLPGAGRRAVEDVTTIAEHIKSSKLKVKASCAARTHVNDIHATLLHLLGFDHTKLHFRFQGLDARLTGVFGELVTKLVA